MKIFKGRKIGAYINRHFRTLLPFLNVSRTINVIFSLFHMAFRHSVVKSKPFVYRIDPCTACNLRCPNCEAHSVRTTEKRLLNLEDFKSIVDKIRKYALRISLYDTGEPLMNKQIYNMISYASDKNISTNISTNFNLFDAERDLDKLFDSRLTVLEPDLDGFTQETYIKYRIGGDVATVKSGIEAVIRRKRETGAKYPIVAPQVLLFQHLMHEKPLIENYLNDIGVDGIVWKQDTWGFNPAAETDAMKTRARSKRCFWLYTGAMIRPDGNVYPCCGRGFDRLPYGNLLDQSMEEIWNNKYYQFSRKLFQPGPDLEYDSEMEHLPCHKCEFFEKQRKMLPRALGSVEVTPESDQGCAIL